MGTIALVALGQCASSESIIEDTGYMFLKQAMIAEGDSENHANCIVKVLKYTGATSDVTDIRNIINPDKMVNNLSAKVNFADFVCSPVGFIAMVLLFCFVFAICCVCLKRCCCTNKPMILQMASPQLLSNNVKVPYVRMDVS